jgi:peroxiredoxin
MFKRLPFLLLTFLAFAVIMSFDFSTLGNTETIEIPVTVKRGYGPFASGFGKFDTGKPDPQNPWSKFKNLMPGMPEDIADPVPGIIYFDMQQFVFQKYHAGEIDKSFFMSLVNGWKIDTTITTMTTSEIKSYVNYMVGKRGDSLWVVRFDRDYNGSVEDEEDYIIPKYPMDRLGEGYEILLKDTLSFSYEYARGGKVYESTIPVYLGDVSQMGVVFESMPLYAEAEFLNRTILVDFGFTGARYTDNCDITLDTEYSKGMETYGKDQYVEIDGFYFKNLGLDYEAEVLRLMKMPKDTMLYSTQTGFYAIPFEASEFSTQERIALEDYRGKFLYMDFWGSWCAPCIEELPNLKATYQGLDTSKIDIIGIARDREQSLRSAIDKYEIGWKQILSDSENKIVENYSINAFPTTLLLDPEGKIVARGLRGENLADTLNYYINLD